MESATMCEGRSAFEREREVWLEDLEALVIEEPLALPRALPGTFLLSLAIT
jgi:hypothetical protein